VNGAARASIASGVAMFAVAGIVVISDATVGTLGAATSQLTILTTGVVMIANGVLRLPCWARLRRRQMEALAVQVATPPVPPTSPPSSLPPA
jgi:hypothetical protein